VSFVGVRLAGDIAATGFYRSYMLREQPAAWHGRHLAGPGSVRTDVVLDAGDTDRVPGSAA